MENRDQGLDISAHLVASGLVAELRMAEARKLERSSGRLLEEILLDEGILGEEALARFYCKEFGYPYLGFEDFTKVLELVADLSQFVPPELSTSGLVLPLDWTPEERCLDIAVAFPTNRSLLDLLRGFGPVRKLRISVAPRSTLRSAISAAFRNASGLAPPSGHVSRPRRVLLAEKNKELRGLWSQALVATGQTVAEVDSPNAVSERLKVDDYDLVVARHGPDWQDFLSACEGSARSVEVRFAPGPAEALCGEVVPYSSMSAFFFATLRTVIRLFGRTHKVPAEAILAPPRVARAVADLLGLPTREVDEIHFAAYLASIARALGEDELAFAESLEHLLSPPWRVQRLLRAALDQDTGASISIGARIIRVVFTFLSELKKQAGQAAAAILHCRENAPPGDGPVLETLIAVLYRERVANRTSTQREVLVVEKDRQTVDVLETALRNEGHLVRSFLNGRVAQAELELAAPDLLVTGSSVPGVDGYSLCMYAKKRLGIPTLLLADQAADDFARIRARAVGADHFLAPPLDLARLLDSVRTVLADANTPKARPFRCTGSLAHLRASAILSALCANHAEALIHFWSGSKLARARVKDGTVVRLDDPSGAKLEEVLTWSEGTFMVFDESGRSPGEEAAS